MLKKIKDYFSEKNVELEPAIVEDKHEEEINHAAGLRREYGRQNSMFDKSYSVFTPLNDRKSLMSVCMDTMVTAIKEEKANQPLLSRVINNIIKGVLKSDFSFVSTDGNSRKEEMVKERFELIMDNSSYESRQFLREVLSNLVSYSNAYIIPNRVINKRSGNNKLEKVLLIQNSGWSTNKLIGSCYAEELIFKPTQLGEVPTTERVYKNTIDVWHYTFNRESDEVFGLPMWTSVIPFLKKYNFLISTSIDSYTDQSIEKTIYGIGVMKNGNVRTVTPKVHKDILNQLKNFPEDDLICDTAVDVQSIKKTFTSPDKILSTLEMQIIAGLHTSRSQLGENGAGRQDAETQQESTAAIISDFQENLEDWLNKTIIKEICIDLFGDFRGKNKVRFKFAEGFDSKERKEKHTAFMFQSGLIDLDEGRKVSGKRNAMQQNKSFFKLYQEKEMSGSVSSKGNPKNQHKKTGTGTTKKTKKDTVVNNE